MISVREAQGKILQAVTMGPSRKVPLAEANGRFLAEEILAPMDSPSFDNSAMDGYALQSKDTKGAGPETPVTLRVVGTLPAGTRWDGDMQGGAALRIFTGAMIPRGADAVVRQEQVHLTGGEIILKGPIQAGENIRQRGEELRTGEVVLTPRAALTPASIALVAGFGFQEVPIFSPPRVGILVTGSEIVKTREEWELGKVFDSNSFGLSSALQGLFVAPTFIRHCRDNREELLWAIGEGLEETDFLLVTGGVSVGDFDFVKEISGQVGVDEIFWKVAQKPGKPIFFGKKGERKFLFGLPGNPASALVCFYEYVRPALLHSMGAPSPFLAELRFPLRQPYKKKPGMTHFLRGFLEVGDEFPGVRILEQQGSHLLGSFAQANCLVVIPQETEMVEAGGTVAVHLLPGFFGKEGGRAS
jgi:molybdopterin molybdotransferase